MRLHACCACQIVTGSREEDSQAYCLFDATTQLALLAPYPPSRPVQSPIHIVWADLRSTPHPEGCEFLMSKATPPPRGGAGEHTLHVPCTACAVAGPHRICPAHRVPACGSRRCSLYHSHSVQSWLPSLHAIAPPGRLIGGAGVPDHAIPPAPPARCLANKPRCM